MSPTKKLCCYRCSICNFDRNKTSSEMSVFITAVRKRKLPEGSCLAMEDDLHPMEIPTKNHQKKVFRMGNVGRTLFDLPNELLLEILRNLTCIHQERLVRVCKLWMWTITSGIDHVYLDFTTLHKFLLNNLRLVTHTSIQNALTYRHHVLTHLAESVFAWDIHAAEAYPWKYDRRAVLQFTFNGQYVAAPFGPTAEAVNQLAYSHFPQLTRLNLVHMVVAFRNIRFRRYEELEMDYYGGHRLDTPLLTLKGNVVAAFPDCSDIRMIEEYLKSAREAQEVLGEYQDHYVRIPDVTLGSMVAFARYCQSMCWTSAARWSYPDSQLVWLARWAPALKENQSLVELLRFNWSRRKAEIRDFENEDNFCQEWDLAFCKQLDGETRSLIAVYLLQLKPLGMGPPPVPFQFEKYGQKPELAHLP